MTIEQRIADAVFDLIEMHNLARKPLLLSDVAERVRGVMASEPMPVVVDLPPAGTVKGGVTIKCLTNGQVEVKNSMQPRQAGLAGKIAAAEKAISELSPSNVDQMDGYQARPFY